MTKWVFAWSAILALAAGTSIAATGETPVLGKKVDNFSARDFRGKETSLADFANSKAVVVAFLGTECPQAKLYAPRAGQVGRGIQGSRRGVYRHRLQPAGFGHRTGPLRPGAQDRVSACSKTRAT